MKRILIALLFASTSVQAGSIQKWVDENGNVHYGDSPPVTIKAETINVTRPPSNPGKPLPRLGDSTSKAEKPANKEPEQPAASDTEQNAKACKTARDNLEIINRSDVIRLRLPDGGERLLSDTEIEQRRKRYQENIKRYCQ